MYTLSNDQLTVSILDPVSDVAREGSRYCTGGYIWQVSDARKGDLLAGPEYPKEPNTFDGQGMPDMFHQALGADGAPVGSEVGCIGVGRVKRTNPSEPFDVRLNREVIEFVHWDVSQDGSAIHMQTEAEFKDWAYRLERVVTLADRTVQSSTGIASLGKTPLPIRWFAHPFFPITADRVMCKFTLPVSMPENPGYFINGEGFITRKADHNWHRGWYQALEYPKVGSAMTAVQKHPKVGQVTVSTDFLPAFLPIWGNANTFSFEPYFERTLHGSEQAGWAIEYHF